MPQPRPKPLEGVRVIELGQVYQGPYCGYLLAQAGAEVVKVEPLGGEPVRQRAAVTPTAAIPFALLNGDKRAMTLNLKSEEGKQILRRLVAGADVLIENYAPGVLDRLGVGYVALREVNPRLIYASGSGYGLSGPDRDRQAMDITIQAVSGMMSVTGFPDSGPVKCGPAVVDFLSGAHIFGAIMLALFERTRSGEGQLVEVSMQETVYPTLASNLSMVYEHASPPPRVGNRHGGLAACPYNVYPCADGHLAIICTNETHWRNLVEAIGDPRLSEDPRFATRDGRVACMDEVDGLIAKWSSALPRDAAMALLRTTKVPSAPVRDLIEVTNDPHMHGRGALHWQDHPEYGRVVVPGSPLRMHAHERSAPTPSRRLGEDGRAILAELGFAPEDIDRLERDGVTVAPAPQAAE